MDGIIRIVVIPRCDTFRPASMNNESLVSRPVILTGFSRIRGRLHRGEAMETKKSEQERGGAQVTVMLKVLPVH